MTTNDKIEVIFYNDFRRTTVKVQGRREVEQVSRSYRDKSY